MNDTDLNPTENRAQDDHLVVIRNILGVIKVQGTLLDFSYLENYAAVLKVADLLARTREAS